MKRFVSVVLFALATLWTLMALFKLYLALDGYVDLMGRKPVDHFIGGILQLALAGAAFWGARRLWITKKNL
jgi:hypothetical protein